MTVIKISSLTKQLERKAKILALAGDSSRIRIFRLLSKNKEVNVTDIAVKLGINLACVSHHLQLLKDNKLLLTRRRGNSIYYRLSDDKFIKNLLLLIQ